MNQRASNQFDLETLYGLLPAIYRVRDADQGGPLKDLLSVIAEQVAGLEENLAQLYDDQFIETCAEWVIPYIGDLIGFHNLNEVAPKVSSSRAEVANTIGYRRRKGTAAILEQLARDVTGWPASVVEFFQRLATTQYMNHIRLDNQVTPDLHKVENLQWLGTPFDRLPHTADVRRISSGRGLYNIPNIGFFLFRVRSFELSDAPAFRVDARRFLFNPLGADLVLYNRPQTEEEITHLATPADVPLPITRRRLNADLIAFRDSDAESTEYYGEGRSLWVKVGGQLLSHKEVMVCDLSDTQADPATSPWANTPPEKVAIDPHLGRLAFPNDTHLPVLVSFHYGFTADMGGGEYSRVETLTKELKPIVRFPDQASTLQEALDLTEGNGAVEIIGNRRLEETPSIHVSQDSLIEVRAADSFRPVLKLGGDLVISGGDSAEVTLNGLLIYGGQLRVPAIVDGQPNLLQRLRLRHCTLVPGISISPFDPLSGGVPGLLVETPNTSIEIDNCILGGLTLVDTSRATITNSIVDTLSAEGVAYSGLDGVSAGGPLFVENSTVIGKVHTMQLELASNTIFLAELKPGDGWAAPLIADRRQEGCVRFSYIPLESITPRKYSCQPASLEDAARVRPQFTSLRYGDPGYCQIGRRCPREIWQGADDEAEMGAFHNLFQPQRETNLHVRLEEYLRLGLEAGIFYIS